MLRSLGQLTSSQIRQTIYNRTKLYSTETISATTSCNTQDQLQNVQNTVTTQKLEELDKLFSKLEIELKGIDPAVLKSYSWFATTAANHLDIEIGKCWTPRKAHHKRLTLLKAVHIFRKHRVQYEIRTHYRFLQFHKLTGSTLDTFLEYIERNLPEGVALKATKIEIQRLPDQLKTKPS